VEARPDDDGIELDLFEGPAAARRTDAQGLARFTVLPTGPVSFTVNHPAFAVTEAELTLPAEGELRVELAAGGSIAGQVLAQGAPPAEPLLVMLTTDDALGDAELPRFTLTDREGRFGFLRVEAGEAELQARSRMEVGASMSLFETMFNSPLAETSAVVTEGRQTDVVLLVGDELEGSESGFVSGQLTVNGAPAAGWRVRTWGKVRRSVSTDSTGRFDLGRVEAGEVDLMLSAPSQNIGNGFTGQRQVELQPGERLWVPIDLTVGAITGRVLSASNGQPLAGVEVTALPDGEQGGWNPQPGTVTAHDGSFTIEPVVSGRYRLRASADGYARTTGEPLDVSAFQTRSGIVLRLPKALVVSGTIMIEGGAGETEWMWLVASGGDGGDGSEGARIEGDDLSFRMERLGPGDWQFELNTDQDIDYEPVKLTLTEDVSDLKLVFKPKPPDPEDTSGLEVFEYELK
ncbi:MAG TPA: carboxypeptidase-like regulatory domain-containing protein, partial [Planctomycetota bacterium]|nr:carboxypeptidase-like regulatory domain-containing protein [Planctomycetota bacterium]